MPTQPLTPCRHPGCRELVVSGYCPAHARSKPEARRVYDQTTRRQEPALAWAANVRNGSRWQKVRALYRAQYPTCCDPFGLHKAGPALTAVVNHIVPLRLLYGTDRQEMAYEFGNLASLCTTCDARIGAMERRGESTVHLFDKCKANAS